MDMRVIKKHRIIKDLKRKVMRGDVVAKLVLEDLLRIMRESIILK